MRTATRALGALIPLLTVVCLSLAILGPMSGLLTSCTSQGLAQQPSRAWVEASRAVHDVVAPRFQAYVVADATLDDATRQVLLRTVSDWEFLIRQGELAHPPTPGLPPAPQPAAGGAGGGR